MWFTENGAHWSPLFDMQLCACVWLLGSPVVSYWICCNNHLIIFQRSLHLKLLAMYILICSIHYTFPLWSKQLHPRGWLFPGMMCFVHQTIEIHFTILCERLALEVLVLVEVTCWCEVTVFELFVWKTSVLFSASGVCVRFSTVIHLYVGNLSSEIVKIKSLFYL